MKIYDFVKFPVGDEAGKEEQSYHVKAGSAQRRGEKDMWLWKWTTVSYKYTFAINLNTKVDNSIMSKLAQHKEEVRLFCGGKYNNYFNNNIDMMITITITLSI